MPGTLTGAVDRAGIAVAFLFPGDLPRILKYHGRGVVEVVDPAKMQDLGCFGLIQNTV